MCSSVPQDAMDTMPNENVLDSGANVHPSMEPNVILSAQVLNAEKVRVPRYLPRIIRFIIPQHVASTPQVDSDISDSTSTATVVEPIGDNTSHHMPSLPLTAEPGKTSPKPIKGDDISLNSPSSQIVGTPFAVDSTRFEYPFPDTNQNSGSGSSSATLDLTPSSSRTSPSSTSFPGSLTQLSFPLPLQPSYKVTHPMMKVQANPPIPPTLIKRRHRWNVQNVQRWKPTWKHGERRIYHVKHYRLLSNARALEFSFSFHSFLIFWGFQPFFFLSIRRIITRASFSFGFISLWTSNRRSDAETDILSRDTRLEIYISKR